MTVKHLFKHISKYAKGHRSAEIPEIKYSGKILN